ncbi:MAG: hypothetical protein AAFR63_10585, partial [Cyanobacteria bacterium J06631_6]
MKFSRHPINNLSRPLVVLVVAAVCNVFQTAIAQGKTPQTIKRLQRKSQLVAQVWSDTASQELSLAVTSSKSRLSPTSSAFIAQQLPPQQQLIAQLWSDIDLQQLSLIAPQTTNEPAAPILITQLLPQQQQLIAQLWSDIATEQLSLAPSSGQQSLEAGLIIAQLRSSQQQLLAQLWSDLEGKELSLAVPAKPNTAEPILITQLLPEQQQLIAQVWSDIAQKQLSLATPTDENGNNLSSQVLVTQLLPAEQELIAQVWSDIDRQELSLVTTDKLPPIPPEASSTEPSSKLIEPTNIAPEQQLVAQAWSDSVVEELSLAQPVQQFDQIAALSSPFIDRTPAPPAPSKQEIAARIVLNKVQIITPAPGVIIDGKSKSSVTVQYPANTSVKLEVNGEQVDNALVTREQLDFKTNLITQTWQGATLNEGSNQVSIIASKSGFSQETTREVIVNGDANPKLAEESTAEKPEVETPAVPQETETEFKPRSTISEQYSQGLVKILTPKPNAVLEGIYSSVVIQFPEEAKVILQVNGKSVSPSQVGRTEINPVTRLATQTWYGVIFDSGTNRLSVLATTDGQTYSETAIAVKVPGKPEALEVSTVEAHIPADGRSIANVKGRFLDGEGETAVWSETITLNSSEGEFIGNDFDPDQPGFQVRTNQGEFFASLQAGYEPARVTIQAKGVEYEAYSQIQFKNTLRDRPLLTGFANLRIGARGTDYYDSFRDFLPLDEDNDVLVDFDSAAFITGSWGRWSYTGAYNSDRSLNEDSRGEETLFRSYSSNESNYPIYGDSSTTEVVTPSIDRVYFLLERNSRIESADPDYFLWGDYNTEEFSSESQEFSAINRQLHGFKSNYNLGAFQFNALYANNIEGFQRDAIAPDGTSGFYFLSRRLVIPGSEDVYLELSPLNDAGNVVSRQRLSFGLDYEIDYDRGTLLFKEPVLRTEVDENGNILARRIVATYQFESEVSESDLLAGRARFHFDRDFDHPTWLGGTYVNEDRGDQDFELYGFDAFISLGSWGSLSGEYANSENETIFADASGSAYRFEGKVKFSNQILGRAYYREASEGFANNATLSFVPGQTRYGSELTAKVAENTDLRLLYERQENKGIAPRPLDELEDFLDLETNPVPGSAVDNNLSSITAGLQQRLGSADLGFDLTYRDRQDNTSSNNLTSTSTQLRSRFSIPLINKLNFHALSDLTLSNNTDAVFSDRLGVGLDYEFLPGLSAVLNQQWFTRGNLAGEALTTLGLQGEYEPWTNATFTGKYGITNGVAGVNNTGSVGLQQMIPLAPGLEIDLDYERTFNDFSNDGTGRQFAQPFGVGQSISALGFESGSTYGVGIKYTDNPDFTADAKFQYSDGKNGSNTVISGGVTGKLTKAITTLFRYSQANSANQTFDIGTTRDIRLGLAYRHPEQDKFNALLRYEYEENGGLIPETILLGSGTGSQDHLFAGEVIYAPNWRWEFYSKLAYRNSRTFVADDFVSSSNISLGQLRTTYRLNYHMDLVAEGRSIWQPSADYTESAFLLEAGYYLSPELRLAAGYVFGRADDEDFTGTRSAGGPYFGMTVKLNSLLDGFGQHRAPDIPEGVAEKAVLKDTASHKGTRQKAAGRRRKGLVRMQAAGSKHKGLVLKHTAPHI